MRVVRQTILSQYGESLLAITVPDDIRTRYGGCGMGYVVWDMGVSTCLLAREHATGYIVFTRWRLAGTNGSGVGMVVGWEW